MSVCDKLGIPGMKEFIDYMLVFDYLMANTDRHFGNFGAIQNVETLEWIGPAPIFDSGTSLWHDKLTGRSILSVNWRPNRFMQMRQDRWNC